MLLSQAVNFLNLQIKLYELFAAFFSNVTFWNNDLFTFITTYDLL